jgi:hypothetical protein
MHYYKWACFVSALEEREEESLSAGPDMRGITLKTINKTVKIRTTTIVNGDMGFSFLDYSKYLYVGRVLFVPFE